MIWRTIDGYWMQYQLVDKEGRILGTVSGSEFESKNGWYAGTEKNGEIKRLGRFITSKQAKAAVENAITRADDTGGAR